MGQTPCGDLHDLGKFLNEELPPDQAARLVIHIETCKECQSRLEQLVASPLGAAAENALAAGDVTTESGPQPGPSETILQSSENGQAHCQQIKADSTITSPGPKPAAGDVTTDFNPSSVSDETTDLKVVPKTAEHWWITTVDPGSNDSGATADFSGDRVASPSNGQETTDLVQPANLESTVDSTAFGRNAIRTPNGLDPSSRWPKIPGYELISKLGEGGMGVVFLARQTGLNRRVALKMIRGGQNARSDHFSRFRIEAEAVAGLRHPNILQIYEIGEVDDLPFVSLELLEGGALSDRLDGTPQPGRKAAELMVTLAEAVQAAHEGGIVHRDLKPPNILFTEDGVPKITDFGLAKQMESDSGQTETGQIMGSPSYMAPEQASGHTKDVGPAADIYALGAILYEMLTGRPPFRGESVMETVRQVIHDEVVLPSKLAPRVSRDLETICLKCLSKSPLKRYSSAAAMVEDLRRYLNGETILARRTPPVERAIKWARRKPLAAVGICLGLVTFLSLPPAWMIRQQRLHFEEQRQSRLAIDFLRKGDRLIDHGREANSREEISTAQVEMSNFLGTLKGFKDERIEGLPERIEDSLTQLDRRMGELTQKEREQRDELEKQKSALAEKQRFRTFVTKRTRAQLSSAEFEIGTGDRSESFKATREALAVYSRDPSGSDEHWELATPLPEVLTETEKRRVIEGCYDLLLGLSRGVEPSVGLKVLDLAATLRPESTGAYHLRRADCLARAGDVEGGKKELRLAGEAQPTTALDHLLIGREYTTNRQWGEAIRELELALRLEPDQASAKLLLAICEFNVQPRRLDEAIGNLNDCIAVHSDLVGLYLLRALFYGDLAYQTLARVGKSPAAEANSLKKQADEAFQAAEADYRTALEQNPGNDLRYVLLVNRAGMMPRVGRLNDSIVDLEAAIAMNPKAYQAHATLGQLYQQAERLEEASEALGRAIERAPDGAASLARIFHPQF